MTIEDIDDPKWAAYDRRRPKEPPKEPAKEENREQSQEPPKEMKLDDLKDLAQKADGLDKLILAAGWEIASYNTYEYEKTGIKARINAIVIRTPGGQEAYKIWPAILIKNTDHKPNEPGSEKYIEKAKGKEFMCYDKTQAENYLWALISKYTKVLDEKK